MALENISADQFVSKPKNDEDRLVYTPQFIIPEFLMTEEEAESLAKIVKTLEALVGPFGADVEKTASPEFIAADKIFMNFVGFSFKSVMARMYINFGGSEG